MSVELIQSLREQYQEPHEQAILNWAEENDVENVVFYPQNHPTVLITWISPDPEGRELFREIDIVFDRSGGVRVSGGAMYHAPTYHLAWLPVRHGKKEEIAHLLGELKPQVDQLRFEDMTDMDAYLGILLDLAF
ncbi:MAG: hypothetical protein KatS3mg115_0249 [Candidatus Poribacteria bacterium]|nr:MAG: hypothetical protein KatS3mg115_0249 [Candidatus Poribacteria bacterium]